MTSGTFKRLAQAMLAMSVTLTTAQSAEPDAATLIQRLARPAPAQIAFTEVRFSPLLREPVIVAGELHYGGASSLDRRVTQPYIEETQIRGDSVRVTREGEPTRSFALKRAPELRGLLAGFTALLAGDAPALEREFKVASEESAGSWKLVLTPLDARTRKRLDHIEVMGRNDQPRCFTLVTDNKGASIMLLGAQEAIAADVTRERLEDKCEGGLEAGDLGRGQERK